MMMAESPLKQQVALADLVKMPKRLQVKKSVATDDATTAASRFALYNCCPQAAYVDKQLIEHIPPVTLRANLINAANTRSHTQQAARKSSFTTTTDCGGGKSPQTAVASGKHRRIYQQQSKLSTV